MGMHSENQLREVESVKQDSLEGKLQGRLSTGLPKYSSASLNMQRQEIVMVL
jgi:hypothetical protein